MSRSGKVSFFARPDLKDFLHEPWGEMVAGGFMVDVVYEPAPSSNVWYDGATFFQTPGKPRPVSDFTPTESFEFRADRFQLWARYSQ
jgi:hypothetical protein